MEEYHTTLRGGPPAAPSGEAAAGPSAGGPAGGLALQPPPSAGNPFQVRSPAWLWVHMRSMLPCYNPALKVQAAAGPSTGVPVLQPLPRATGKPLQEHAPGWLPADLRFTLCCHQHAFSVACYRLCMPDGSSTSHISVCFQWEGACC